MCPNEDGTQLNVKNGNPVLDGILNGELPAASTIALIGAPGTGTSIMTTQYVVNALKKGKRVIYSLLDYVPGLAEKYFKSFGFNAQLFLADKRLQMIDGYEFFLRSMGIATMADIQNLRTIELKEISQRLQTGLMSLIRDNEKEPSSVVIDSFTSLSPFVDVHSIYEILAEGFAMIRRGGHPALLVAHEGVLESNFVQALTRFVDGVIRLKMQWSARGLTRGLFIEKLRRTNVETPYVDFTISDQGISLHYGGVQTSAGTSRSLTHVQTSQAAIPSPSKYDRISTGIAALDPILEGGFPRGTFICAVGDVGTGTSTFCTQFAWSRLLAGGKVAYYCVDEPPDMVINQFRSYGWDIGPYVDSKDIVLSDVYNLFRTGRQASLRGADEADATRKLISEFMKAEIAKVESSPPRDSPLVAVVDSFTTMAPYLDLKTAYVLARIVADNARASDETYLTVVRSGAFEANLLYACLGTADGIITLDSGWEREKSNPPAGRRLVRRMRIDKMAFTSTPSQAAEYEITSKGIQLISTSHPQNQR
ncbi:MAG: ATPase domain-containing protein [Promethearchaeati archaeon SRVP18_Atabeyarchaeia-1]